MKIAIYGGSYNPIHRGHTELAQSLVSQGLVDQVWLMVSPLNPLKESNRSEYATYDDRVRMAQLATADIDGVVVSDFERTLPLPSYTITTLNALQRAYPQHQFVLVVGADNWQTFSRWYKSDEIRRRFPILVYNRPGYEVRDTKPVDTPLYDISSTRLRAALRKGESTADWLHPDVLQYIKENHLYE